MQIQFRDKCPFSEDYDPASKEHAADPFPLFAQARALSPVFYDARTDMWIITRYDELVKASLNNDVMSCTESIALPPRVYDDIVSVFPKRLLPDDVPVLVNADPPQHTRVRKLVGAFFAPSEVAKWEQPIIEIVDNVLDGFVERGNCELVSEYSQRIPLTVTLRLMGMPLKDFDRIDAWITNKLSLHNPNLSTQERQDKARVHKEFCDYLADVIRAHAQNPSTDLLSKIIQARDLDDPEAPMLNFEEQVSVLSTLIIGGLETSKSAISTAVYLLLTHPETYAEVRADLTLIPKVVEETLRVRSPVLGLYRTTKKPLRIGDVDIPEGARVQLLYGSANRDSSVFSHPDQFDIHRADLNKHVAFGRSIHFCLGAPLARLDIKIAVTRLLERLPNLRLKDPGGCQFNSSVVMWGPTRIELEWDI
jgi:cytochrome P450